MACALSINYLLVLLTLPAALKVETQQLEMISLPHTRTSGASLISCLKKQLVLLIVLYVNGHARTST